MMSTRTQHTCGVLLLLLVASSLATAQWQTHTVHQLNGQASPFQLAARFQIVTESWNRVVAVPFLVYMPEKNRLLMLVGCDYPHRAFVLTSDDQGATWSAPRPAQVDNDGQPSIGMGTSLVYLGDGKLLFYESAGLAVGAPERWFSSDYGQTWNRPVPIGPAPGGQPWSIWDPPLVERHPETRKVTRLIETGYHSSNRVSQAYLRSSTDLGRTWSKATKVPQWYRANEICLLRTGNGRLLAACRTDIPERLEGKTLDHYEGLGISFSDDEGRTWSPIRKLYDYGRHHPSLVLMPNHDIVMTYVVRLGYTPDPHGYPQFAIEAIVSHDHGVTWDLDHRYLLHVWSGKRKGDTYWWPSSQATSSVLLPDASILTLFGTGYRIQASPDSPQAPRDAGLVRWQLNHQKINDDRTIRQADFDSELRNRFDPGPVLNPRK